MRESLSVLLQSVFPARDISECSQRKRGRGKKRLRELSGAVRLKRFFFCLHRTFIMKNQLKKLGMAIVLATMPLASFAADSIDPAPLVEGINAGKPVVLAVGAAIFALVGLVVALTYGKRAAK